MFVRNQVAGDANSFMKFHEVRGCIAMDLESSCFHRRAQIGQGRAFAVGASNMNDRRQLGFRMIKACENPLHTNKIEIDDLWMKREQARENGITQRHGS